MANESVAPRAAQLVELAGLLRAGRGGLALVTGEAGVGKTWLAGETARMARGLGAAVAWSACWEGDGAPAFWPWIQLLRELGATAVAELFLSGGDDRPTEPAAQRFRLVEAVDGVLRGAEPLLLLIDDLQWADPSSVRLLELLVPMLAERAVTVLGTVRSEPEQPTAVAELRATLRIRLGGMAPAELAVLLGGLDAGELAAVHERTGGNPLYATELVRLAQAEGVGVKDAAVPGSVRAVLGRRLDALSPDAVAVLRVAAVLGSRFRFDHLAAVLGGSSAAACAVDEATAAGLVRGDQEGRHEFAHPLIREVVYDGLGMLGRIAEHERVADALAAFAERGGVVVPAVLAVHYGHATPVGRAADAVRHGLAAAESARVAFGYEEAVRWLRTVVTLLGTAPGAANRGAVLLALAEAELAAGNPDTARAAAVAAAEVARSTGNHERLALAALALTGGVDGFEVPAADASALALLQEARAAQPAGSPSWVRLTARLAVALTRDAPRSRRTALADGAVAAAREHGDPALVAIALAARCDTMAGPGDAEHRLTDAEEIIALARVAADARAELLGRRLRLVALLERGDVTDADFEISTFASRLAAVQQPLYAWCPPLWRAARAWAAGQERDAAALLDDAAAAGEGAGSANAEMLVTVARWLALVADGDGEAQYQLMTGVGAEVGYVGTDFEVSKALCAASVGHLDAARAALDRLNEPMRSSPVDSEWTAMLVQATAAVALVGGHPVAVWLYEVLLPHRHRHAVDGIGAFLHGSVERPLGTLAAVLGRTEDARAHFAVARAAHVAIGAVRLVELTDADERRALGPAAACRPAADGAVFGRDGEVWSLAFAGRAATVRNSKGMTDLAVLLARPGTAVPSVELAGVVDGGDLGDVVDGQARSAYRTRLAELDAELTAADDDGDATRSARAHEERAALLVQLGQAYGVGGRARRAGSPAERARTTVTWRIRDALRRIESVHPELARHLRHSVRTGSACSYEPETPVPWQGLTS